MPEWMRWVIGDHHWGFPHCGTGFPHSGDVTVGFPSARDDVTDDDDDNVEMLLWQRLSREQHDVTGATRLHKRHSNGAVINCHNHWHSPTHGVTYLQTHTHPFNGPFSGTTQVSRHQKGKTNLDFTEARDSEWHWHQLGHMQVCTSPQTDNHASTPPLSFLQAGCPSCRPTNSVNALKLLTWYTQIMEMENME